MKVEILRLGHLGDGIAEGPVYVPGALPGELVEGEVSGDVIAAPKIVTPSPERVRAPCRHYKGCGGCALQHAADPFVAAWKTDVVRTALAGQGLEAEIRPIATSPAQSRRRAVLAGRRTKKGVLLGFHGRASDTVVAVPDCLLLHPELIAAFPALEALTLAGASRKGELSLTVTRCASGPDVAVSGGKELDVALHSELAGIAERFGLSRLAWGGEVVALRHPPYQAFGAARVVPPPGAFLQATAEGEKTLLSAVSETVAGARHVADLFAGCGTFALPLAENAEVHAVEGSAEMTAALDKGWRAAPGLKRVTTEARDLFRRPLMADELRRFDAVVIDPPRAGAEAQAVELARSEVPVIAAVSCNPVTFARDARLLVQGGYRLDWVRPVDQFRWSPHVELAARFSRTG
ncbi:class I SAM-dependent RNA methyltransferase [Acidimangrovimonas pyrenivorans]|uniref:Class I SAM-dependent RNA methyltransferase n=1 Tax=Acidimangrovimonas pyrenivorans TaxID=2030798 RepID=A0ABV7ALH2_9RHOB